MSKVRINKNRNYTVVSNHHLRNKNLSCAAKGLLTFMLSLPDDWDYSIAGLEACLKEGKKAIRSMLKELEQEGYLVRTKTHSEKGRFAYIYDIFEEPNELSTLSTPYNPKGYAVQGHTLKDTQISKDKQSKDKERCVQSTLTPEQLDYLLKTYNNDLVYNTIERAKQYKNCYNIQTIESWINEKKNRKSATTNRFNNYTQREYSAEEWQQINSEFFN